MTFSSYFPSFLFPEEQFFLTSPCHHCFQLSLTLFLHLSLSPPNGPSIRGGINKSGYIHAMGMLYLLKNETELCAKMEDAVE